MQFGEVFTDFCGRRPRTPADDVTSAKRTRPATPLDEDDDDDDEDEATGTSRTRRLHTPGTPSDDTSFRSTGM